MGWVIDTYIDPGTRIPLLKDEQGNLCMGDTMKYPTRSEEEPTYDFGSSEGAVKDERAWYDEHYASSCRGRLLKSECSEAWQAEPGFAELLASVGDLRGKTVLLLGNGVSVKEFDFLSRGAKCVYTDLSIGAVLAAKGLFGSSEFATYTRRQIEFHAVDAYKLPFEDGSFDVIYACMLVHHLSDIERFLCEICRCLRPGGICRFADHAYSPMWQLLKGTVLKPLQLYSHKKHGISPEDLRATRRGGFKRDELERAGRKQGLSDMLFSRTAFFEYMVQRGTLKFGGRGLRRLKPLFRSLDRLLQKTFRFIDRNGIVLVWGFTKE